MEVLRRCPLAIAQRLVHCAVTVSTAVLGSHKDNVRCTAVKEQPEAKKSPTFAAQLHLPVHGLFCANLRVQLHLPPLDLKTQGMESKPSFTLVHQNGNIRMALPTSPDLFVHNCCFQFSTYTVISLVQRIIQGLSASQTVLIIIVVCPQFNEVPCSRHSQTHLTISHLIVLHLTISPFIRDSSVYILNPAPPNPPPPPPHPRAILVVLF